MSAVELAAGPATAEAAREPPSMSARRLLRDALPPVFRDGGELGTQESFALRWLAACEEVLDPVQALLDNLPAHLDPALAPADLLDLLGHWLGLSWPAGLAEAGRRRMLAKAIELAKLRGTQRGLELAFELAVPELPLTVTHSGVVSIGTDPSATVAAPPPWVEVSCPFELGPETRAVVRALIEDQLPVQAGYRLIDDPAHRP